MPKLLVLATFLAVISVFNVKSEPKTLLLNRISPMVLYTITGIEPGSNLYVASNDDNTLLKGITVTSGVTTFTLDEINYVNADGTASFFTLHDNLTISTSNDYTVTQSLTGFIYVTSLKQAVDPNFSVFVVKSNHTINIPSNFTAVILNTALGSSSIMDPLKTTYISKINQSPNSDLHFHYGYPPIDWLTQTKNRFFNNPMYLSYYDDNGQVYNTTRIFFPTVEPLQINLDYWYFTTSGPITMEIENKYKEELIHNTTSVNATGVIVNNYIYQEHLVNFDMDYTRGKTVGMLISATLDSDLNVYFMAEDGGMMEASYHNGTNLQGSTFWSPLAANKLVVNSSSLVPGTFYCQYFVMSGDLLPGTSTLGTVPTTKNTVASTVPDMTTVVTGPANPQTTVPTDGTVPYTIGTTEPSNPTVSSTATVPAVGTVVTSAATVPSMTTVPTTAPTDPSTTYSVVTTVPSIGTVASSEATVPSTVPVKTTVPSEATVLTTMATVPTDPSTKNFVVTTVSTVGTVGTSAATVPSTVPTDATVPTVGTVVTTEATVPTMGTVPSTGATVPSTVPTDATVPTAGTVSSTGATVPTTVPTETTVPARATTVPSPSPSPSAPPLITSSVPPTTPNLVSTSAVPPTVSPTVPPTSTTVPTTTQSAPGYSLAPLASVIVVLRIFLI